MGRVSLGPLRGRQLVLTKVSLGVASPIGKAGRSHMSLHISERVEMLFGRGHISPIEAYFPDHELSDLRNSGNHCDGTLAHPL